MVRCIQSAESEKPATWDTLSSKSIIWNRGKDKEVKNMSEEHKLKEFINIKPSLKEMLKGLL